MTNEMWKLNGKLHYAILQVSELTILTKLYDITCEMLDEGTESPAMTKGGEEYCVVRLNRTNTLKICPLSKMYFGDDRDSTNLIRCKRHEDCTSSENTYRLLRTPTKSSKDELPVYELLDIVHVASEYRINKKKCNLVRIHYSFISFAMSTASEEAASVYMKNLQKRTPGRSARMRYRKKKKLTPIIRRAGVTGLTQMKMKKRGSPRKVSL